MAVTDRFVHRRVAGKARREGPREARLADGPEADTIRALPATSTRRRYALSSHALEKIPRATVLTSRSALAAHVRHRDTIGPCP